MTKEKRSALQSVRAKARKALAVENADLPKTVTKHLDAVIAYVDKQLAPKAVTKKAA